MEIPAKLELMNRGPSYLLSSKFFLAISVAVGIRHSALHNSTFDMLDYVCLQKFDNFFQKYLRIYVNYIYVAQCDSEVFTYLRKLYLRSTMWQTRLSSITIINIDRSYSKCILQEPMDRITDFSEKEKIVIFFETLES